MLYDLFYDMFQNALEEVRNNIDELTRQIVDLTMIIEKYYDCSEEEKPNTKYRYDNLKPQTKNIHINKNKKIYLARRML